MPQSIKRGSEHANHRNREAVTLAPQGRYVHWLDRDAMDVRKTVEQLAESDIRVHCLALGGVDLTSAAGKMTMQVISAVAEFEKDLLIERTHSGLARARAAGKRFGRPPALNNEQRQTALEQLKAGASISAVARQFGTSRQTIMRLRDDAVSPG